MPETSEMLEKIRQQFNDAPYPNVPLEKSAANNYEYLYTHSLLTAYYRRDRQLISTKDRVILDVGCGSGYKSLLLAEANPGARIIGIDISETSVDLAQKRLSHYGFENSEFHVMAVEELEKLKVQFDYINCDETLYLLADPVAGLGSMKQVLKPAGIMRVNFHSSLQRQMYHQIQEFSRITGIMDEEQETSIQLLRGVMGALKPQVIARSRAWNAPKGEPTDGLLLANHLLRGDKGWTIPTFFDALRESDLEFFGMVDWPSWDLLNLFDDPEELPLEIAMRIADTSEEEQLHMFELLQPSNRLLDIWCGNPSSRSSQAWDEWSPEQWQSAVISLHPQLDLERVRHELTEAVTHMTLVDLNQIAMRSSSPILVNSFLASCLLMLFDRPQSFASLMQRWQQIYPIHLLTMTPTTVGEAYDALLSELERLVDLGYLLAEQPGVQK